MQELSCKDSRFKTALLKAARKQHFIPIPFRPDWSRHLRAVHAFAFLGPENKSASLQALAPLLDNPDLTGEVIQTMNAIAPRAGPSATLDLDALPLLAKGMANANPVVRARIIEAMIDDSSHGQMALTALISGLKDPDAQVRSAAALDLGRFVQFRKEITPALTDRLQDSDATVRQNSAEVLNSFDWVETSKQAVPFLKNTLADPDAGVRKAATNALAIIAPETLEKR